MNNKINEALKQFDREDLIDDGYERDLDDDIEVFLTIKQMIYYNKLQSNWNSLREWLEETKEVSKKLNDQHWFYYKIVLDKMNELESGDNK